MRYKRKYADLLVLHFVRLLNPWLIVEIYPPSIFFISITIADVHLNWLSWFHFLILEGGLLFILIDCLISQSPFLDVIRMSMSKVSFLTQLDPGILSLENAFL